MAKNSSKGTKKQKGNPIKAFQNALERKDGDATQLATDLFNENFEYRERIRELEDDELEEGSVVLSPEDSKLWKEYKTFRDKNEIDDFEKITKPFEKYPKLKSKNTELEKMETYRDVAAAGIEGDALNVKILADQMGKFPKAEIEIKTEPVKDGEEGQTAQVAYITNDGKVSTFADFAKENLADYLPALKVSNGDGDKKTITSGPPPDPKPKGKATDKKAADAAIAGQSSNMRNMF